MSAERTVVARTAVARLGARTLAPTLAQAGRHPSRAARLAAPGALAAIAVGLVLADAGFVSSRHAALLALTMAVLGAFGGSRWRWLAAAGLVFAAGSHSLATRLETAASAAGMAPFEAIIEGRVAHTRAIGSRSVLTLHRVRAVDGPDVPVRMDLFFDGPGEPPAPGTRMRARVRGRPLAPRCNPGRTGDGRAQRRRGVGARAAMSHPRYWRVESPAPHWRRAFEAERSRIVSSLREAGRGGPL
ncbi:MAG: hypothetical protein QNK05_13785, partial [Myxococcota bacterium]|nr:hypothetical protein [Myxococcota bacterium]